MGKPPFLLQKDDSGNTPIHLAVQVDDLELVKYLMSKVDIGDAVEKNDVLKTVNNDGNTPIHLAVATNKLWIAGYLLQQSYDFEKMDLLKMRNNRGLSPIHIAVDKGYLGAVDWLLEPIDKKERKKRAEYIDWRTEKGSTPLMIGVTNGNLEMVNKLLEFGAKISVANSTGDTPLLRAMRHSIAKRTNAIAIFSLLRLKLFNRLAKMIGERDNEEFVRELQNYIKENDDANLKVVLNIMKNDTGLSLVHIAALNEVSLQQVVGSDPLDPTLKIVNFMVDHGFEIENNFDEDGNTALHHAVRSSNLEIIQYILHKQPSLVNILDKNKGNTLLHYAIRVADKKIAHYLIEKTAINLNAQNKLQKTPLMLAAEKGWADIAKALLEKNVDLDLSDFKGNQAIDYAHENPAIKKMINEKEAELFNEAFEKIVAAIQKNDLKQVVVSLSGKYKRALLTRKDEAGNSVLHLAVSQGKMKIVELLIKEKAPQNSTDSKGNTPLHVAIEVAKGGRFGIVRLLLENNANINIANDQHETPLMVALRKNNKQIVRLLLKSNASIDLRDVYMKADERMQAVIMDQLHSNLISTVKTNNPLYISDLLGQFDVNDDESTLIFDALLSQKIDDTGNNILHLASEISTANIVSFLLQVKTDNFHVNIQNREKQTPLHKVKNEEIARSLVAMGARLDLKDSNGNDPIHSALLRKKKTIASYLIAHLVKSNQIDNTTVKNTNKDGDTYLHLAAQAGFLRICQQLLATQQSDTYKNILSIKNNDGNTPLHLTALLPYTQEHKKLILYLTNVGADVNLTNNKNQKPSDMAHNKKIAGVLLMAHFIRSLENLDVKQIKNDIIKSPQLLNTKLYDDSYAMHWVVRQSKKATQNKIEELIDFIYSDEIKTKPSLKNVNASGQTLLHIAALAGNTHIMKKIFDYNKTLTWGIERYNPSSLASWKDKNNNSPLHLAARSDSAESIEFLLDKLGGYKKDVLISQNKFGLTPLHIAVERFEFVDISNKAAKNDYLKILELLKDGINITTGKKEGTSPLHIFAQTHLLAVENPEDLMETSLADININLEKKQQLKKYQQNYWKFQQKVLKKLLSFKDKEGNLLADLTAQDASGNTALHYISNKQHEFFKYTIGEISEDEDLWHGKYRSLIKYLTQDKEMRSEYWNHYHAITFGKNGLITYAKKQHKDTNLINTENNEGLTIAHFLAQHAPLDFLKQAEKAGANLKVASDKAEAPISLARNRVKKLPSFRKARGRS